MGKHVTKDTTQVAAVATICRHQYEVAHIIKCLIFAKPTCVRVP
jgi:hypothetical protein